MVKRGFARELHRHMSMYRVNHEDLAWLMGYRWGTWLLGPIWDPRTTWFEGNDPEWAYPIHRNRQLEILNIIAKAQDNPEYWRRKYAESKNICRIYGRGLEQQKRMTESFRQLYWRYYRKTYSYWTDKIRYFFTSNYFKLRFYILTKIGHFK